MCLFIGGYRLTSLSAIKANANIGEEIEISGEIKKDWATVYLIKTKTGIKTALTLKTGPLWSCKSFTYFYDDIIENDAVKTVGWESYTYYNTQITVLAIQSKDTNVKFIEVKVNLDIQRKYIQLNKAVVFVCDKSISVS